MLFASQEQLKAGSPTKPRIVRPYSRAFKRGAIGDSIDGRSKPGRLIRRIEKELLAHLGHPPSIVERLLIARVCKLQLQLEALDAKIAAGAWTDHDARTYGGILGAFRLALRELGMRAPPRRLKGNPMPRLITGRDGRQILCDHPMPLLAMDSALPGQRRARDAALRRRARDQEPPPRMEPRGAEPADPEPEAEPELEATPASPLSELLAWAGARMSSADLEELTNFLAQLLGDGATDRARRHAADAALRPMRSGPLEQRYLDRWHKGRAPRVDVSGSTTPHPRAPLPALPASKAADDDRRFRERFKIGTRPLRSM